MYRIRQTSSQCIYWFYIVRKAFIFVFFAEASSLYQLNCYACKRAHTYTDKVFVLAWASMSIPKAKKRTNSTATINCHFPMYTCVYLQCIQSEHSFFPNWTRERKKNEWTNEHMFAYKRTLHFILRCGTNPFLDFWMKYVFCNIQEIHTRVVNLKWFSTLLFSLSWCSAANAILQQHCIRHRLDRAARIIYNCFTWF